MPSQNCCRVALSTTRMPAATCKRLPWITPTRCGGDATDLRALCCSQLSLLQVCEAVQLRVLTNWGDPEYTCLYRFRVHGEVAPNHPTLIKRQLERWLSPSASAWTSGWTTPIVDAAKGMWQSINSAFASWGRAAAPGH